MTHTTETSAFRIDFVNLCVWRSNNTTGEERLDLAPKTFDLLRYLVENAGRLVTHDEILTALWRDVHVQPEVIKSHILAIRNLLRDHGSNATFIETQRGRGYRFIGEMDGFVSPVAEPELELGLFAGRAEPMRQLLALFHRAVSGHPSTVFISGEPGIGKTTLIGEFLRQIRNRSDLVIAHGHCIESFAGAEAYYPVLEALSELCTGADRSRAVRALLALAPSWAIQMPAQVPVGQRAALRQQATPGARSRMIREACSLFEALAMERPLILILEDLHWADFATIDFISALCRRRSTAKLLLIATYRPEDLKTARHPLKQMTRDLALRKYCTELVLVPLPVDAITKLLSGKTDVDVGSLEFTRFIMERTGGNPLFMRATLEYLSQRGDVVRTADGWQPVVPLNKLTTGTPPTLARAIEIKIEAMTDEQRRVLEAASVAGDYFDPVTAAPAAEVDIQSFEAICESLTACKIRRDKMLTLPNNELVRTYTFTHAVYRQILYEQIGQIRRAQLHRAIGERIEEIYPPDQRSELAVRLAHHFAFARDWSRALGYLRSALHVANSRFARRDALAIIERATDLSTNLADNVRIPAQIEFLERRAALEAATHDPKAQATYAQLAEKANQYSDIDTQCRALIGLSYTLSWHDNRSSLDILDQARWLCEKQTDPVQQDIIRVIVYVRRLWGLGWDRGDAEACENALVRLRQHGDELAVARAQANFSMLCMISTRYQEAVDLISDSYRVLSATEQNLIEGGVARLAWMRQIGVPWALLYLGDFGTALKEFDSGIATFEGTGDASGAHSLKIYRSILLFHAMDYEGVLDICAAVATVGAEVPDPHVLPVERRIALIFCGLAEAGRGNNTAARRFLLAAESEMAQKTVQLDWYWRLALEWGMVNVLIAADEHVEALAYADRLCDLAGQTDERTWQALAWEASARAALSLGDTAKAAARVASALLACEGGGVPLAEWRVHATAAMTFQDVGDGLQANMHIRSEVAIRKRLADTLPKGHLLRLKLETAIDRRFGDCSHTGDGLSE